MVRCGAVQCGAVWCGAVRCSAVRCSAVLHCAVLCCVVLCCASDSVTAVDIDESKGRDGFMNITVYSDKTNVFIRTAILQLSNCVHLYNTSFMRIPLLTKF